MRDRHGQTVPDRRGVDLTLIVTCTAMAVRYDALSVVRVQGAGLQVLGPYRKEIQIHGSALEMAEEYQYQATCSVHHGRHDSKYLEKVVGILRGQLYEEIERHLPSPLQLGIPGQALIAENLQRALSELPADRKKTIKLTGYPNGVRMRVSVKIPDPNIPGGMLGPTHVWKAVEKDLVVNSTGRYQLDTSKAPLFELTHKAQFASQPKRTAGNLRKKIVTQYVDREKAAAEEIAVKHSYAVPSDFELAKIIRFFKKKAGSSWEWRYRRLVPWAPREDEEEPIKPAPMKKGRDHDRLMAGCIVAFWLLPQNVKELAEEEALAPYIGQTIREEYRWVAYTYDVTKRENVVVESFGNWDSDVALPPFTAYKEFVVGNDGRQTLPLSREWKKGLHEVAGVAHRRFVEKRMGKVREEARQVLEGLAAQEL